MVELHAGPADSVEEGALERATAAVAELLDGHGHVMLTSSCTAALELAALTMGLGPGDEVIVPSFTHPSTANAFMLTGATVCLADIDPLTANIDPSSVERLCTSDTRAVVPVHYAGVAAPLTEIAGLCDSRGLTMIEDAAHGIFGRFRGRPLATWGDFGCISFHRTKNLSCEAGGALVVSDDSDFARAQASADKGTNAGDYRSSDLPRYEWKRLGIDGRMNSVAATQLLGALARSEEIQKRRMAVWNAYADGLAEWAATNGIRLPSIGDEVDHPAHIFQLIMRTPDDRDQLIDLCAESGVESARHYVSLADSTFGSELRSDRGCPNAVAVAETLVRLPIHHEMDEDDIDRVLDVVTAASL